MIDCFHQSTRKDDRRRRHTQKEGGERKRDRQRQRSRRTEDSGARKTQSDTQRDAVTRFFTHLLKENTGNNGSNLFHVSELMTAALGMFTEILGKKREASVGRHVSSEKLQVQPQSTLTLDFKLLLYR